MTPLVYEPPLTPGRDDAQRLLDAELRNPEYQQSEGLIERIMRWITEWFESFSASDGQTRWFLIIIVALLAVLIGYAIFRITQRRRISHTHSSQLVGLLVDTSAEEYARLAQEAAAHGRWHDAVLARFRQLVKTAEDNVIIHPDTSRTAHEAAQAIAAQLPSITDALTHAADTFDTVAYGDITPHRSHYDDVTQSLKAYTQAAEERRKARVNAS